MKPSYLIKRLVYIASLVLLTSCGGGGSNSPEPSPPQQNIETPPENWDEILWDQHDWS